MSGYRDMTQAQLNASLARNGFRREGFMGYVDLGIEGQHVSVSLLNAGQNRRAQLAYALAQREKWLKKLEAESGAKALKETHE